jgi:hypothetical protein
MGHLYLYVGPDGQAMTWLPLTGATNLPSFVDVTFSKGLITEWYPYASVPALDPGGDLFFPEKHTAGAITWSSVRVEPAGADDFPTDTPGNRYYAARETSSAALSVDSADGGQREQFLFYRGATAVRLPFSATVSETSLSLVR